MALSGVYMAGSLSTMKYQQREKRRRISGSGKYLSALKGAYQ